MKDPLPGSPAPRSPSRRKRYLPLIYVSVTVLMILASAFGYRAWFVGQAEKAVAELARRLDEKDPGWRWEEILTARKQAAAPERNSAPMVLEAARLLPEGWPLHPAVETAAEEDLLERIDRSELGVLLDGPLAAELRAELDALQPALEKARKLNGAPESGRHDVEWDKNPIATKLPHLSRVNNLGKLLWLDVASRAQEKDGDGALGSSRAILIAARSLVDEPVLVSQLVRRKLIDKAVLGMGVTLGLTEPSRGGLEGAQRLLQLERDGWPSLLAKVIRAERATLFSVFRRLADGELPLAAITNVGGPLPESISWSDRVKTWLYVGARMRSGQLLLAEELTRLLEVLALPMEVQVPRVLAWYDDIEKRFAEARRTEDWRGIVLMLLSALRHVPAGQYQTQMRLDCTILALAAERYRLKHGRWPEQALDLVPEFVKEVPKDIFSREPVRMRRSDTGIIFYSVGPDGVDNGGLMERFEEDQGARGSDIAFRLFDPEKRRQKPAPPPAPDPQHEPKAK